LNITLDFFALTVLIAVALLGIDDRRLDDTCADGVGDIEPEL